MPQLYPDAANFTGIVSVASYANTVSGGWFWTGAVITIFLVVLISMLIMRSRLGQAVMAAGRLGCVISALLWAIGLVEGPAVVTLLLLALIGTIVDYFEA